MTDSQSFVLMLDPSFAFAEEGLAWLEENEQVRHRIAVSSVFFDWLRGDRELDPSLILAPEDLEMAGQRRDRVLNALHGVTPYSYVGARLPRRTEPVLRDLLNSDDPARELRADEWAFLQSHSTLVSKLRHPLDAFRDAGAVIVEFGRKMGQDLVSKVMPKDKDLSTLTPGLMATAAGKWIIVAGATVGGGLLGGVVGTLIGPGGSGIGGTVGGIAGGALGQAAVVAIDP